ncbi:hypothetical protein ACFSOZ_12730 [Mesorhizobium newzealandense]|uniref:DUF2285 domain-containing protein n=1 Tax=Mesorhizobium newzealandense TaxID=1300302 RepID=A0ABW4UAY2_9HYPH
MTVPARLEPIASPAAHLISACIAAATVRLVLADLGEDERVALASVEPESLLAFAAALSPAHRQRASLDVRDGAIRQIAVLGFTASDIEREMRNYAGNGWRRDRILGECPGRYAGRPQAWLWLAFKAHPVPLKRARISQVIENVQSTWHSVTPSDCQQ